MFIPMVGTRVLFKYSDNAGKVVGYSTVHRGQEGEDLLAIVELEKGFWSEDRQMFISLVPAHLDSLIVWGR